MNHDRIEFSENEYTSIRTKMIERIKLLNSQSFTALAAIISFWAAGFTYKMALLSSGVSFIEIYEKVVMDFLSAVIFLIPIFLFVPLSVKSGENLSQIASLSAYIRVFYDYPIRNGKRNMNWETSNNLLSNANVDRKSKSKITRFYNDEYTILSCISFFLYIVFELVNFKKMYLMFVDKQVSYLFFHILIILYIIMSVVSLLAIIMIHKASSMKNTLMRGTIYYVQGYIKRANELGIIKDEDMELAIKQLNPLNEFTLNNYFV